MELVAFSDERIVRAAAACVTPLVSAIGHENDRPLLDDVADLRASTPTDAAKRVVPDVAAEISLVAQLRSRGRSIVTTLIGHEIDRITQLASRPVMTSPLAYIERATSDLINYRHRGFTLLETAMQRAADAVHRLASQLRTLSPQNTLDRGYAIVRDSSGNITSRRGDVAPGDDITIQVSDGSVSATVSE
jgi:exodeoxyribonuclease VII large subunit